MIALMTTTLLLIAAIGMCVCAVRHNNGFTDPVVDVVLREALRGHRP